MARSKNSRSKPSGSKATDVNSDTTGDQPVTREEKPVSPDDRVPQGADADARTEGPEAEEKPVVPAAEPEGADQPPVSRDAATGDPASPFVDTPPKDETTDSAMADEASGDDTPTELDTRAADARPEDGALSVAGAGDAAETTAADAALASETVEFSHNAADPEPAAGSAAKVSSAEPSTPAAAAPPRHTDERRGGFVPMMLGGLVAGGIGFAAAYMIPPDTTRTDSLAAALRETQSRESQLSDQLSQLSGQLAALTSQTEQASSASDQGLAAVDDQLSALGQRIQKIEQRPIADAGAEVQAAMESYRADVTAARGTLDQQAQQIAALRNDLDALSASLDQRLAQADTLSKDAESAKQATRVQAAMNALQSALDTGQPYTPELESAQALVQTPVPDALQANAADGVATLAALQSSFAPAAQIGRAHV